MRVCMRPVNLGRIVDIARITQGEIQLTPLSIQNLLLCSERHAREILDEMCDLKLLTKEGILYSKTTSLGTFRDAVIHEDWQKIHTLFLQHAHYKTYYDMVCKMKTASIDELLTALGNSENPKFNKTSIDIVNDWAERIGSIQRDVVTGEIYPVLQNKIDFKTELLREYQRQNTSESMFLKQIYVEIPKLREAVCRNCCISRSLFDELLKSLSLKNIGKIELSGAPVNTHAKKTMKKVKHITTISYSDRLSMKLTSDQYLSGVEVDNRLYYYLAYHGGELND